LRESRRINEGVVRRTAPCYSVCIGAIGFLIFQGCRHSDGTIAPQPKFSVSQTASFEAWKGQDHLAQGPMVPEAVLPTGIGGCCLKACSWNQGGRAFITEWSSTPLPRYRQQPRQQISGSRLSSKGLKSRRLAGWGAGSVGVSQPYCRVGDCNA
jgi:hypothetical protein